MNVAIRKIYPMSAATLIGTQGLTPLVFAGPSGVGKGTLVNLLMTRYPDIFGFSVSNTTRQPRYIPNVVKTSAILVRWCTEHRCNYRWVVVESCKGFIVNNLDLTHLLEHTGKER